MGINRDDDIIIDRHYHIDRHDDIDVHAGINNDTVGRKIICDHTLVASLLEAAWGGMEATGIDYNFA